jgi:hypothetical protein
MLMKGLLEWARREVPEGRNFAQRWLDFHLKSDRIAPFSGAKARVVRAGGISASGADSREHADRTPIQSRMVPGLARQLESGCSQRDVFGMKRHLCYSPWLFLPVDRTAFH